jgi:secreted Zn-dependent insulinase-like peptidase
VIGLEIVFELGLELGNLTLTLTLTLTPTRTLGPNAKDDNSATTFYFQLPSREIEDYILLELLAESLEQAFYNSLRTQQQLGYITYSGVRSREGI